MEATVGDPVDPVIIHTSKIRRAELAYSYEEEKVVILLALTLEKATCPTERVSKLSDSQFLLEAIQSAAHDTLSIR